MDATLRQLERQAAKGDARAAKRLEAKLCHCVSVGCERCKRLHIATDPHWPITGSGPVCGRLVEVRIVVKDSHPKAGNTLDVCGHCAHDGYGSPLTCWEYSDGAPIVAGRPTRELRLIEQPAGVSGEFYEVRV